MREDPYLNLIVACHRVDYVDGRLDLIGLADMITVRSSRHTMTRVPVSLVIMVAAFSQRKNWTCAARLTMELPTGEELDIDTLTLGQDATVVGGGYSGRLAFPFEVEFQQPGVHWLHVYFDGELRGSSPLWVRFERELVH